MHKLEEMFLSQIASGISSSTLTYPTRWAKHKRLIPNPVTHELEPYCTKYHPWCESMLNSEASFNYIMKGAQLGISELALNLALFTIDVRRVNALYVLPTTLIAGNFSKARINSAIRQSPSLNSLFTDTDSVLLKQASNGANLYITGAKGDANLREKPASVLFLDEVDVMDEKQVGAALERLSGHIQKTVWGLSTPSIPNVGIHKLFLSGTQEFYFFKCPCCSRLTNLTWPDCIEIVGESVYDPRVKESFLKCQECKGKLLHEAKPEWLKSAIWVPTNKDADPDRRSLHISQMYSFTINPGELAVKHFESLQSDAAEQELWNDKLGLPHVGEGAQATDAMLDAAIERGGHSIDDTRPATPDEKLVTLGVDSGKTCWYVVCEWFVDRWSNDINAHSTCKVLDFGKFYEEDYWRLDELMSEWQVLHCVIDPDPQINEARRFARKYPGFVKLCRYRRGLVSKEMSFTEDQDGATIATVDRTNWMSAALRRFYRNKIILPRDASREFRAHMKAPVRRYRKDDEGQPHAEWVSTGPDHWAHALTYAEIGLPFAAAYRADEPLMSYL